MAGRALPPLPRRSARRGGFSLVELLIVIGIIATLAGLLLVGIRQASTAGKRATVSAEVTDLAKAMQLFKQDFGFYPPTRFAWPAKVPDPSMGEPENPNVTLLQRMFRSIPTTPGASIPALGTGAVTWPTVTGTQLDSNQCLVLFLGGPGLIGWSPTNPESQSGGTAERKKYYDFAVSKMSTDRTQYLDPWKQPYLYMQSDQTTASAVRMNAAATSVSYPNAALAAPIPPGYTDPSTIESTWAFPAYQAVNPYADLPGKPMAPGGVQIVSAGPDQFFGFGGGTTSWTPGSGLYADTSTVTYGTTGKKYAGGGHDDFANFGSATLGVKK